MDITNIFTGSNHKYFTPKQDRYLYYTCIHGKSTSYCKDCGGSALCKHKKYKSRCKDCGGSALCKHNEIRTQCEECKGKYTCIHGKYKSYCKDCGGSAICEHGKRKSRCRNCGGSYFCEHGKQKSNCKECGGSALCKHGKYKSYCKDCGGSAICEHGKYKIYCKKCDGSYLCKSIWCESYRNKKYNGYCLLCCVNLFPDIKISRNYKTKENEVVSQIKNIFPEYSWIFDKTVQNGCSKRRPDMLLDMGLHIIIIEVDENRHNNYECICENKRLMELSKDLYHRPIVFIRFNPDAYINKDGIKVSSCWKVNKNGLMSIIKKKQKEWDERIESLKNQIQYWIDNKTNKTIEIIELFY